MANSSAEETEGMTSHRRGSKAAIEDWKANSAECFTSSRDGDHLGEEEETGETGESVERGYAGEMKRRLKRGRRRC